jgi:4-hydroxy-tetrahydrodipicolinate synthase
VTNQQPEFPGGVWPTMVTPFTDRGEVDLPALQALTRWYAAKGCAGVFAVCQSSEMFHLSLEERVKIARTVAQSAPEGLCVIASGHISEKPEDQARELRAMAGTGVQALILITNRLAAPDESDDIFLRRLDALLRLLPSGMPLGFYECPYPYKRLLSEKILRACAGTGRFFFIKDTSCDLEQMRMKLAVTAGTPFKLYNANAATLLGSLRMGAAGYCGVMANFHPELYVRLLELYQREPERAEALQSVLAMCALIESHAYPVCAKYALSLEGLPIGLKTRSCDEKLLTDAFRLEVRQLGLVTRLARKRFGPAAS